MDLVCLINQPFIPGDEVDVLAQVPQFTEEDAAQVFIDDPWFGVIPLTVQPYVAGTYPTFNTWGEIMFDATARHFRCGTPLWWGKILAYVVQKGAKVLTS